MQRKTFVRTLLALAVCAATSFAVQAQTTKLTLGHGAAPGNPRHEAAVLFAERVKAKTNGRIEIQVAHSAQLGDDAAMVTALRSGTLDMSANSQGAIANVVPEYARDRPAVPVQRRAEGLAAARRPGRRRARPSAPPPRAWSCSATGTTASAT